MLLHLLPILVGGGPGKVTAARERADRGGPARWALINLGGVLTLVAPGPAGIILLALGLLGHVLALALAVTLQYRKDPS